MKLLYLTTVLLILMIFSCTENISNQNTVKYVASVYDTNPNLDGAYDVETVQIDGRFYLVVSGEESNGISLFDISTPSKLAILDSVNQDDNTNDYKMSGASGLAVVNMDEKTFILVAGYGSDGITIFELVDYRLEYVSSIFEGTGPQSIAVGSAKIDGIRDLAVADVDGKTYVFAAGHADDGISVFEMSTTGTLTHLSMVADDATYELDGVRHITTDVVGTETYLFAAGEEDDGVSVFKVEPGGNLTHTDSKSDDIHLQLDGAFEVITAHLDDQTFLFVSGSIDNGVTVFSVSDDGTLTYVAKKNDFSLGSNANQEYLGGAKGMTTVMANNTLYLLIAASLDNAVGIYDFAKRSDGQYHLEYAAHVADNISNEYKLGGLIGITYANVSNEEFVFVSSFTEDAVSSIQVDPRSLVDNSLTVSATYENSFVSRMKGISGMATGEANGKIDVFTVGDADIGISAFRVSDVNHDITYNTHIDNDNTDANQLFNTPIDVEVVDLTGSLFVYLTSKQNAVTPFKYTPASGFELLGGRSIKDPGDGGGNFGDVTQIEFSMVNMGGTDTPYLFVSRPQDSKITAMPLQGTGTETGDFATPLKSITVADTATAKIAGVDGMAAVQLDDVTYVFGAGKTDNGFSIYTFDGVTFTSVSDIDSTSGASLEGASDIAVFQSGANTYIYVSAETDNAINVFSFNDEKAVFISKITDDASYELDGVGNIHIARSGTLGFLAATGKVDNGVSFYMIGEGSLSHIKSFDDEQSPEYTLKAAGPITSAVLDGTLYYYIGGHDDNGFSVFKIY